jgi:hypothetical protein
MFQLLPGEAGNFPVCKLEDTLSLRRIFAQIGHKIVVNYFDVVLFTSMQIEIAFVGYVDGVSQRVHIAFYNHKGYTYFTHFRFNSPQTKPKRSTPFLLPARREWVIDYIDNEREILVTHPSGQLNLDSLACTQLEFIRVSFTNREIAIFARTNAVPNAQIVILIYLHSNLPEIACFSCNN